MEGVVEQGQIKLADDAQLPDNTRVVVVVQDGDLGKATGVARVVSPRLATPTQAKDFEMEVVEEEWNGSV